MAPFGLIGLASQGPDRAMQRKYIMAYRNGRERAPMTDETYRYIWERLQKGDLAQDIAADLNINIGRVSEVKTGRRGSHITGVKRAA